MANLLVLGTQWGDEGKGKIVDLLTPAFDVVARYQGGHNAGHTVYVARQEDRPPSHPFRDPPAGHVLRHRERRRHLAVRLFPGDRGPRGPGHPGRSDAPGRQPRRPPDHALASPRRADLRGEARRRRGSARPAAASGRPTRTRRPAWASGPAIWPISASCGRRSSRPSPPRPPSWRPRGSPPLDAEAIYRGVRGLGGEARALSPRRLGPSPRTHEGRTRTCSSRAPRAPSSTSTTAPIPSSRPRARRPAAPRRDSASGPRTIHGVLGITKAYTTRVGSGPFPTELFDETGKTIAARGDEFGASTGRPRRCGWFDAVAVRYACRVNGIDRIALTKPDVLAGLGEITVCTGYRYKGELLKSFPPEAWMLEGVVPEYRTLPGWPEFPRGAAGLEDLPPAFVDYVRVLEDLVETRVAVVSTGVAREQTLFIESEIAGLCRPGPRPGRRSGLEGRDGRRPIERIEISEVGPRPQHRGIPPAHRPPEEVLWPSSRPTPTATASSRSPGSPSPKASTGSASTPSKRAPALRAAGIAAPVLVLGYAPLDALEEAVAGDLRLTVYNRETVERLADLAARLGRTVRLHVKVETGTWRQGVDPKDLAAFVRDVRRRPGLAVEGAVLAFRQYRGHDQARLSPAPARRSTGRPSGSSRPAARASRSSTCPARPRPSSSRSPASTWPGSGSGSTGCGRPRRPISPACSTGRSRCRSSPSSPGRPGSPRSKRCPPGPTSATAAPTARPGRRSSPSSLSDITTATTAASRTRPTSSSRAGGPRCGGGWPWTSSWPTSPTSPGVGLEDEVTLLGADGRERITAEDLAALAGTISYEILARINPLVPRDRRLGVINESPPSAAASSGRLPSSGTNIARRHPASGLRLAARWGKNR